MSGSVTERYLLLGLRLGRHVDGIVDAYYGPPELAEAVASAEPVEPRLLVEDAEALLHGVPDGWLRDQIAGLRTYAGALAGDAATYSDEVEGCYGVRPPFTDEEVFAAAHAELEQLLPGEGGLADRHERWKQETRVPADRLEPTLAGVIEAARTWTRDAVGLPEGEGVSLEIVHDEPWMAFCEYRGGLQSHISVNGDLPIAAVELLRLAIHETYPGHHAESCSKDQLLVRGRGWLEETILLVPTPQSLVSEGIASLAPELLLEGKAGPALAAIVHDGGVDFDLPHALAVERALEPCEWAVVNAAVLLHERGETATAVQAYLRRWGLLSPELAAHAVRFLEELSSRTYILTYPAGLALCRVFVAGEPGRFRRLLTERVRVGELLAAADARS